MTELMLFLSTFVAVFALGFQSLNVNNGHYVASPSAGQIWRCTSWRRTQTARRSRPIFRAGPWA